MTDLEYLDKVIHLKSKIELKKNEFCWLYPFTNENILGYYKEINFKDRTVLTPTASGDHIFNALYMGVKSVDAFDINPLAKYYVELKKAAINALSIEEFIYFFYNKNYFRKQKKYFDKNTYFNKIRKYLDGDYRIFWDHVFCKYSYKELYRSYLFTQDFLDFIGIFESNIYLKEYYKFKKKLNGVKINYHDINIKELDILNKKFDIIILSNIPTFIDKKGLQDLKNILEKIKKEDTKIVLNYYYASKLEENNNSVVYNKEIVNEYFNNYKYHEFESSDCLSYNMNIRQYLLNKKDSVLISN